jgi:hypothetical protein
LILSLFKYLLLFSLFLYYKYLETEKVLRTRLILLSARSNRKVLLVDRQIGSTASPGPRRNRPCPLAEAVTTSIGTHAHSVCGAFLDQVRRCQVVQGPVAKSESSCRAYAHLDLSIRTRRRGKLRSSTGRKYWSKSGFPRASEVTAYYFTPQHTPLFDVTRSSAFTLPSPPVPARAVTLYTLGLLLCHQNKMLMMSCHIILRPSHRKLY